MKKSIRAELRQLKRSLEAVVGRMARQHSLPSMMSARRAAYEIGITTAGVRRMVARGLLLASRTKSGALLISASEVDRLTTRRPAQSEARSVER